MHTLCKNSLTKKYAYTRKRRATMHCNDNFDKGEVWCSRKVGGAR